MLILKKAFIKIFLAIILFILVVQNFSCSSKNDKDNDTSTSSIKIIESKDVVEYIEPDKKISISIASDVNINEGILILPDKTETISSNQEKIISVPKGIKYLMVLDKNNRLVAITGAFNSNTEISIENIAFYLVLLYTPLINIGDVSPENLNSLKLEIKKLNGFNNLYNEIKAQLNTSSYIDLDTLFPYLKQVVLEFFNAVSSGSTNIASLGISLNPNEEYHKQVMLRIYPNTLEPVDDLFDEYGNQGYSLKISAFNKGPLWLELYVASKERVAPYGGLIAPQMVSDFMGTFTSYSGLKKYFSDVVNFNFTNSTWDAKQTDIYVKVSCKYNYLCVYYYKFAVVAQFLDYVLKLGSIVGGDKFNNFTKYLMQKPDLVNQIYIYIENEEYTKVIDTIKKEVKKWIEDKAISIIMERLTSSWNRLKDIIVLEDVVQSQLTFFLSKVNLSRNPRYCWVVENIPCGKAKEEREIKDYNYITNGKVVGGSIILTENTKIRIVPDVNWKEGSYDGIVCEVNREGKWGDRCILYTKQSDFEKSLQCQFIIFDDNNSDWRFNKEEENSVKFAKTQSCLYIKNIIISDMFISRFGDFRYLTYGTLSISIDLNGKKVRIIPDTHWNDWDDIVCSIDQNGNWGENCRISMPEEDFINATNCQLIVFEDLNNDWESNASERHYYFLETQCKDLRGITITDNTPGGIFPNY